MSDLTNQTVTNLVPNTQNGVQDWATRHANHGTTAPGHGGWGRLDVGDPGAVPDPRIASLSPATVAAAAGAVTVTVNGSDFLPTAVIEIDNVAVPTTYVNQTRLTTSYDPTTAGTKQFTVRQGPEESNNSAFTVT